MAVWTIAASTEPNGGPLPARTAMLWPATSFQNTTALLDSRSHPRKSFRCAKATVAARVQTKHTPRIIVFILPIRSRVRTYGSQQVEASAAGKLPHENLSPRSASTDRHRASKDGERLEAPRPPDGDVLAEIGFRAP